MYYFLLLPIIPTTVVATVTIAAAALPTICATSDDFSKTFFVVSIFFPITIRLRGFKSLLYIFFKYNCSLT